MLTYRRKESEKASRQPEGKKGYLILRTAYPIHLFENYMLCKLFFLFSIHSLLFCFLQLGYVYSLMRYMFTHLYGMLLAV